SSFRICGRSLRLIEKARQAPVLAARSGGCCDRCFHCNLLAYKWVGVPASYCFVAKVGAAVLRIIANVGPDGLSRGLPELKTKQVRPLEHKTVRYCEASVLPLSCRREQPAVVVQNRDVLLRANLRANVSKEPNDDVR